MHLLFLLAATAVSTLANSVPDDSPLPEAGIAWHGPVTPGGHNVTLYGKHHHDLATQLAQLDPFWWNETLPQQSRDSGALEKRGRVSYMCNQPMYGNAQTPAIRSGIAYIQQHFGNGICGTAPNSCGRFSCSYDSAILMCNSGSSWVWTPCPTLATNANFILTTCLHSFDVGTGNGWQNGATVEGQAFYVSPTYNVLIKATQSGNGC